MDIPVFVKNPINPDLQLWVGALERLARAGLTRLAAIHRGFSWFERTPYRNSPMWEFPIRLKAAFPELETAVRPQPHRRQPGEARPSGPAGAGPRLQRADGGGAPRPRPTPAAMPSSR